MSASEASGSSFSWSCWQRRPRSERTTRKPTRRLVDKALALNDVTGDDTIKGEIKAWSTIPQQPRNCWRWQSPWPKEKDQPFNYNGAFILANAALAIKDLEASRTFFWVCAEQANMLQSSTKLGQSYTGLDRIQPLYRDKKYEANTAKLSQEFLEMMEKQGVSPGSAVRWFGYRLRLGQGGQEGRSQQDAR